MKISGSGDMRLPYSAPCAELFTLVAVSSSLLVSFSANFDEEFDDGTWITDVIEDDTSI